MVKLEKNKKIDHVPKGGQAGTGARQTSASAHCEPAACAAPHAVSAQ